MTRRRTLEPLLLVDTWVCLKVESDFIASNKSRSQLRFPKRHHDRVPPRSLLREYGVELCYDLANPFEVF